MALFAVLMPNPQPALVNEIKRLYPHDYLALNDTQYLVSASGTAIDLTTKLGMYDPTNPAKPPTGTAVVLLASSYFGRGPTNVWEWIKTKLEAPPSAAAS